MPKIFEPKTFARCRECQEIVYSRYSGQFSCCDCFEKTGGSAGIFVDETRHYVRVGGDPEILDGPIHEENPQGTAQ